MIRYKRACGQSFGKPDGKTFLKQGLMAHTTAESKHEDTAAGHVRTSGCNNAVLGSERRQSSKLGSWQRPNSGAALATAQNGVEALVASYLLPFVCVKIRKEVHGLTQLGNQGRC